MQIDIIINDKSLRLNRNETTTPVYRNDEHYYFKRNEHPERVIIEYFASHAVRCLLNAANKKDKSKVTVKSTDQSITFIAEEKRPISPISQRPLSPVALVSPNLKESEECHQEFKIIGDLAKGHTLREDQLALLARIIVARWLVADYDMNATNVEILTKSISQDKLDANNAPTELLSLDYGLALYPVIERFTDEVSEKKILPKCFTKPQDIHEFILGCLFDKSSRNFDQEDSFLDDHSLIQSADCLQNQKTLSHLATAIIAESRSLISMDNLTKSIHHIAKSTLGELILIDLHLQKLSIDSIDTLRVAFNLLESRTYRRSVEGKKFSSTLKLILKKWQKKLPSPKLQSLIDKIHSKIQAVKAEGSLGHEKLIIPGYQKLLHSKNLQHYQTLLENSITIILERALDLNRFLDQPFLPERLKEQYIDLSEQYGYEKHEIDTQWIDDLFTSTVKSKVSTFDSRKAACVFFPIPDKRTTTREQSAKSPQPPKPFTK